MTGFDDLIEGALPYLAREEITATQGTTWDWSYTVKDDDGELVDLTSGFTGTCAIQSKNGTTNVVSVAVTFPAIGQIRCKALPTATDDVTPAEYVHEVTLTRASDSAVIIAVGGGDSRFLVKAKVAL